MTPAQFYQYENNWVGVLEASGRTRDEAVAWLKDGSTHIKPRVRVKAGSRVIHDQEM